MEKGDLLLSDVSTQLKNKNITTDVRVNIATDVKVDTNLNDEVYKFIRDMAFCFIGANLYFTTQMMLLVMAKKISPRCSQKAVLVLVSLSVMSFGFFGFPSVLLLFRAGQRTICEDIVPTSKDKLKNILRLIFLIAGLCLTNYRVIHAIYVILGC